MNYLRLLQLRRMANMMAPDAGGASGADEGGKGTQTDAGADGKGQEGGEEKGAQKPEKLFTQADVDTFLDRAHARWQRRQEEAVNEAARLAKMSAEERAAEEASKREEALNKREAELVRRELRAQALEDLAKQDMPAELADVLDYTDADACSASIKRIKGAWQKAVQKGVEARVAGGAPKAEGKGSAAKSMREAVAEFYNK